MIEKLLPILVKGLGIRQFLKFSTTYAIVMLFSQPFNENFKFLKNCQFDFHKIWHRHYTPEGAPACAMASKSYNWDMRNIAKISPKLPKNGHF